MKSLVTDIPFFAALAEDILAHRPWTLAQAEQGEARYVVRNSEVNLAIGYCRYSHMLASSNNNTSNAAQHLLGAN